MTSADNTVTVDIQDGIAVITIDRPEVRNAINASVLGRISRALDELADNDDAQIVIFTGAGDKAFIGGSVAAAFFQGVTLGGFLDGITVSGRSFAGGPLD